MSVIEEARRQTRLGRRVIPIPGGSKNPNRKGWQDLRLTLEELPRYFNNGQNLGLLCGEPSGGLVDVDLDAPEALALASHFLPATGMRHGRPSAPESHAWYVAPEITKTTKFRDPTEPDDDRSILVEIRSTGGQTVLPPSRHPQGERYQWVRNGEPARVPGDELLGKVRRLAACALLARHWPSKGTRDEGAIALSGALVRAGWTVPEADRFIELAARAAGDEEWQQRGKTERTAQTIREGKPATGWPTVARILGQDVADKLCEWLNCGNSEDYGNVAPVPFDSFELPVFPTNSLPAWLRAWVEAEAEATQTPVDLAAMLGLTGIAVASGKKFRVAVTDGYAEPVNLYTATAQRSGSRKSRVFADAVEPLADWESEKLAELGPDVAEKEAQRRVLEQRLKRAETEAANAAPTEREERLGEVKTLVRELAKLKVPKLPRLLADDCSPERLASLLSEHDGRMAVMSPEGDAFDLMAGRYSSNGGPNFGVFLKGHAGDDLRVDRVGRRPEYVRLPALTLGLAVQPDVIQGLADKPGFRGRGLLGRFLYSVPRDLLGSRKVDPQPMPAAVRDRYSKRLKALLDLEPGSAVDEDEIDLDAGVLTLDVDALQALRGFQAWIEPQLATDGDLGEMPDWAAKLPGAVVRIAGLLHLAEHSDTRDVIDVDTMRAALKIGHYLIPHAKAAFALMGANPAIEKARHLWAVIERREATAFSKQNVWQWTRGGFKRANELDEPLAVLVERHYIFELQSEQREGPGRKPSRRYRVNPLAVSHNTQNTHNSGSDGNSG